MCFTGIITAKSSLMLATYGQSQHNDHGFAIVSPSHKIRTLNRKTFWDYVNNNIREIKLPIMFHYRLASVGAVNIDNVQLWTDLPFYAAHNGTFSRYNALSKTSDSREFAVNNQKEILAALSGKMKKLKDKLEAIGHTSSVLFIGNKALDTFLVISLGKPVQIYHTKYEGKWSTNFFSAQIPISQKGWEIEVPVDINGWTVYRKQVIIDNFEEVTTDKINDFIAVVDANGGLLDYEDLDLPRWQSNIYTGYTRGGF
ncbi:MAG: hypothetical protein WHV28_09675 [Bacteroidota bacterium]